MRVEEEDPDSDEEAADDHAVSYFYRWAWPHAFVMLIAFPTLVVPGYDKERDCLFNVSQCIWQRLHGPPS